MKRKRYAFCLLFVAIVLIASVLTPDVMYANSTKVDLITAKKTTVKQSITVTGKIASENEKIQTADKYYVVKKVLVNSGESVKTGDNLFLVDVDKTKEVYAAQSLEYNGGEYITSFFSGTVNEIYIIDGITVKTDTQLLSIVDPKSLCAELVISEDVFSQIKLNQKVSLTGNGFKNKTYEGQITEIGAVATTDVSSLTIVPAKVSIENPDENLKSGFTVKAKIVTKVYKNVVVIPSSSICADDDGEFVYLINGSQAKKRYVTTDIVTAQGTVITDGISAGEAIITAPEKIKCDSEEIVVGE